MKPRVIYQPRPLSEFPEVMTLKMICEALGKHPRFGERLVTLQNRLGTKCLPDEIPNVPRRYSREAVAAWMLSGVPAFARKLVKKAA